MNIIRTPVLPVKLEIVCECSDGRMEHTGRSMWQGKNIHQHKCTKCDRTEDYELIYPHINFDPLPQSERDDLIEQLRGRAKFCKDRGEVKTPDLLLEAANALSTVLTGTRYSV